MGSWSIIGEAKDITTVEETMAVEEAGNNVVCCQGSPMLGAEVILEGFTEENQATYTPEEEAKMLEEALEAAKKADQVVLFIGEDRLQSGEATSNATIQIPQIQQNLLERVAEINENIAVVLFSGRPLDLRDVQVKAKAILEVWMPGTEGAGAITDVLYGRYNPTGKLPMSFPYCVGQVPVHYNEYATGRPHVEGKDKDRFRSKYLDIPNAPLYPFGYGLSYTTFTVSEVSLDKDSMKDGESIRAAVTVKNTGTCAGTETIQLYLHDIAASVVRPVKELKDFRKVTLQPEEEARVEFTITEPQLRFLSENNIFESEAGIFEIFIGTDSTTTNKAKFTLEKQ